MAAQPSGGLFRTTECSVRSHATLGVAENTKRSHTTHESPCLMAEEDKSECARLVSQPPDVLFTWSVHAVIYTWLKLKVECVRCVSSQFPSLRLCRVRFVSPIWRRLPDTGHVVPYLSNRSGMYVIVCGHQGLRRLHRSEINI
jgi:hypothetical protein